MSKPQAHKFVAKLGNDEITFETGQLAGQANGASVGGSDGAAAAVPAKAKTLRPPDWIGWALLGTGAIAAYVARP